MSYAPDPGGNFESDAHRRVMAHLPNPEDDPMFIDDLIEQRINHDPHTLQHFTDAKEVELVLLELDDDGYAKRLKSGWKNTKEGFDLLTGPPVANTPTDTATIGLDPAKLSSNGGE